MRTPPSRQFSGWLPYSRCQCRPPPYLLHLLCVNKSVARHCDHCLSPALSRHRHRASGNTRYERTQTSSLRSRRVMLLWTPARTSRPTTTDIRNRPRHCWTYSMYTTKSSILPPPLTTPTPPKADITLNVKNYDTKQWAHRGR